MKPLDFSLCGATFIEKSRPGGEMADATDLKSVGKPCGFESRPGHVSLFVEKTRKRYGKSEKNKKKLQKTAFFRRNAQ